MDIRVRDLVKRYSGTNENTINSISFDVKEGEFFSFIGPNGAGKTTTILILTSRLSKTKGKIHFGEYDIDKRSKGIKKSIGVTFHDPSLDTNLTGEENIRFYAALYGIYHFFPNYDEMDSGYKEKLSVLIKVLDIEKDIFNPVKTYSTGMKRKVEIIRSLLNSPEILFLDEPTAGLDPVSRKNLWGYIKSLQQKHKLTVFLTTHYLEEIENATHINVIVNGEIIFDGTPEELKYRFAESYLFLKAEKSKERELELELLSLQYKYSIDNDMYKVYLNKDSDLQSVISGLKTKLSFIDIKNESIKDAYIKMIQSSNGI